MTSAYVRLSVRPSARTDTGGGEGESQDNSKGGGGGGGECRLFLAGNRKVLSGNRRFPRREIA